ncbi:Methyl-Cpg-Binding Domain Protein 3-Like 2 [Manis pentadactyla]|nr:Methyl-Cpg-Binding Domain Protein 3-Like 2 [Manis pentadactyla]
MSPVHPPVLSCLRPGAGGFAFARLGAEIRAPSPGPAPARAPPPGCRSLLPPRLAARWSGRGCRRALGPFGAPASDRAAPRSWVEREARVVWPVASRAGAGPQAGHRGRSRCSLCGRGHALFAGTALASPTTRRQCEAATGQADRGAAYDPEL